jgi:hypothetical protein
MERCILIQRWKHRVERCLSMRCQAYARRFKCLCACDFPCQDAMAYEDVFGHGASLGEKRSVLIFEGATPTFCFSILNKVFSESFPVCWFACESQSCFSNSALWSSADFFPTSEESDLYLLSLSLSQCGLNKLRAKRILRFKDFGVKAS